jgi:hypothetical protein
MYTLDKKLILKEIEILIRSIKVHYDNIENEHRIPTIELELITSKIRKLHEKSIIYNHLHYLEEENALVQKREKEITLPVFEEAGMKSNDIQNSINPLPEISSQPLTRAENPVLNKPAPENFSLASSLVNDGTPHSSEDQPSAKPQNTDFKLNPLDLSLHLGLNDRFWFISELFNGSVEELNLALNNFSNTPTNAEGLNFLEHLAQRLKWNRECEAYEHFIALINKRFGNILQHTASGI